MTWLTAELPGSGGQLHSRASDFIVTEVLSYAPSGEGEHALLEIEKIDLTTPAAIDHIARALGIPRGQIGYAGLKDKYARTRQWISIPAPVKLPLPSIEVEMDGVRILSIARHKNKIRRGHQRGNHFSITISDVPAGGLERAERVLERLRTLGVPNAFGPQRFGNEGGNVERGLAILRGEAPAPRNRRIKSLLMSSVQSQIFNDVLAARIEQGSFATALLGDVMQKHDTHGLFDVDDPETEQPRVDRLEISPTAALPGKKVRHATGVPQEMERAALARMGISDAEAARLDTGTRRALRYPLEDAGLRAGASEDSYVLDVTLPSGAYATVLLAELMKPDSGVVRREAPE